jgi:hypothetical protein
MKRSSSAVLLLLVVTMTLHIGVVGASWWSPFSLPRRHRGAAARSPATAGPGVTLRVDDYRHQVRILARLLN